jgi:hypothetical protein
MFLCPDCGNNMKMRTVVTRLEDYDGWNCIACDSFYRIKDIKNARFTRSSRMLVFQALKTLLIRMI